MENNNKLDDKIDETVVKEETGVDEVMMTRLDKIENELKVDLEESQKEVKELSKKISKLSNKRADEDDDVVDTARQSAHIMSLPMIEGAPIIKSEVSQIVGIKGIDLVAKVKNADGEEFTVPFGCDIKKLDFSEESLEDIYRTSYENLTSQKFELADIDENDLTGASRVEKGRIVSKGALVPEIDRSTGTPIATGRKIRTVVRRDIRYYTIVHNGKKFTMDNEELANIRI